MEPKDIAAGDIITGFSIQVPCSDEICRRQIADSMRRGLPEAVARRTLAVIANGPSARDVDLHALQCDTLALNGALQLFIEQGLAPTYWACCDPQALVADFIPDHPPRDTIYYVASKCHPSVFDKLKDRDVRLWHLMDQPAEGRKRIAVCSTITLSASWLMAGFGYTDFGYWGWDGCFIGGKKHAAHNNDADTPTLHINFGGEIRDGEVIGGRTFATSRSWATEKQGAEQFFQLAKYFGIEVTVHGDGMFKCAKEALDMAA